MSSRITHKFSSWNLNKKIYTFVTSMNYCISIIMLALFIFFYITSYIKQSNSIAKNQLTALGTNYEYTLNSYRDLAEAIVIDNSVQQYLKSSSEDSYSLAGGAINTLQNAINMYSSMVYIAVVNDSDEKILGKGNNSRITGSFENVFKSDYAKSQNCCASGQLRMSYSDAYLGSGNKTMNIYIPVYSTSVINKRLGLLCMIFDSGLFKGPTDKSAINLNSQVMMIDNGKSIVSCTDGRSVGQKFWYAALIKGNAGNFVAENNLYNYRRIEKWNFYLVEQIPLMNMYRNSITVIILLVFIFVAVTYFGLMMCKRIIDRTYRPLDNVLKAMNSVAEGQLGVRINLKNVGIDFVSLANGFNYMMTEISTLMEQVKSEQQQMDQIRFNALQSQIQPHFLYNALDSIHWQAMADGNTELSDFVKALAQYYRLCLSNGKDVIRLEQEIEHVKNYLIIQNMRYDDIIESKIEMDDDCRNILIPKITLQPLVENSIYHGIKVKEGKRGKLEITVHKKENDAYIVVSDNGIGMPDDQIEMLNNSISEIIKDSCYGICNVNKRLSLLYGHEYGLHYEKNEVGGITVTVHLPCTEIQ